MMHHHQPSKSKYDKLLVVDGDGDREWIVVFALVLFLASYEHVGFL
jgi:hypothetical protein